MTGGAKQASDKNKETSINWEMQNPYAKTAYERDYWAPDSQEQGYVNRLMQGIAEKYGQRGAQVQSELSNQGVNPASGTIGQFAYSQQVTQPRSQEERAIANEQYGRRWAGEQAQLSGQRDYTNLLNQLGYQKAAGEQAARFNARENLLDRRRSGQASSMGNLTDLASSYMSAYGMGGK